MTYTARDIDAHMRKIGTWVDWAGTCDTFKAGDPGTAIDAVAVAWMSSTENLKEAHRRGCNLFITHEPTFYDHMDCDPAFDKDPCTIEKRKLLAETGMVIYRCHDVWDRQPECGIQDTWADQLGLTAEPVAQETFMRVMPVEPQLAARLAEALARRVQQFGQPAALLVGPGDKVVSRLGIGTGAICSVREYHRMGADVGIVTELLWWRDARWAKDMNMPLIVFSHTVSEEPGMIGLAGYLREHFAPLRVEYLPTHCPYELVVPAGPKTGRTGEKS